MEALEAATEQWNAWLPAGTELVPVTGTCTSGPNCVNVIPGGQDFTSCGFANGDFADGVITGNAVITLHPNQSVFTDRASFEPGYTRSAICWG
jgi:hypothetical protein